MNAINMANRRRIVRSPVTRVDVEDPERLANLQKHAARIGKDLAAQGQSLGVFEIIPRRPYKGTGEERAKWRRWWKENHGLAIEDPSATPDYRPVANDAGETFPGGVDEAAAKCHLNVRTLEGAVLLPSRVCGGKRWCYADEPYPAVWSKPKQPRGHHRAMVSDKGEYWPNVSTAAGAIGKCAEWVRKHCKQGKALCGRMLYYADSPEGQKILAQIQTPSRSESVAA